MRFADTSFWVALQFARDANHQQAVELWRANRETIVTTNHVLGETWTFLNRRLGHSPALEFIRRAQRSPRVARHFVGEGVEAIAWEWLERHDERPYSFVDATSFATMRRLRIREALAFDADFTAAGFMEVRR